MRHFFSLALFLIFLPSAALFAAPTAPERTVWIEPASADAGEEIELNAFVYNATAKTATVTVLFATPDAEVATAVITVAPQTGKVALAPWQVPNEPAAVTASVVSALDAAKKNIPELLGIIGVVTVGETTNTIIPAALRGGVESFFSGMIDRLEPWRKKQAEYFVALRDQKKDELGVNTIKDLADKIEQPPAEAPAQEESGDSGAPAPKQADLPIGAYLVLLYASALATIFSSATLFYVTAILLAIMVLRFFFSIFR